MKRILGIASLFGFALCVAGWSAPATPGSGTQPAKSEGTAVTKAAHAAKKAEPCTLTGELVKIDQKAGTLTVKTSDGKEKVFTMKAAEAQKAAGSIKTGDTVCVTYTTDQQGTLQAVNVKAAGETASGSQGKGKAHHQKKGETTK